MSDLMPIEFKCVGEFMIINKNSVDAVTPELLAELFAGMGSDEQARFFNHVDKVASTWRGGGGLSMQLQYVTDDDGLTLGGRRVMQAIGDYSHWGLVPNTSLKLNWTLQETESQESEATA